MTTYKAWLFIPKVLDQLCQLSSSNDNGQTIVIHPLSMKHAPSVVFFHDNGQSMDLYPYGMKYAPSVVCVS